MTATLAASAAILKLRYPEGKLPTSFYSRAKLKFLAMIQKKEDWTGGNWIIAMQNENPQGSSADFQTALGSLAQGNYKQFSVDRKEHFGIARIKGQALKAAEGEGAMVDLWKNETEGIALTEMINHEIYLYGNGNGVLGRIASGQSGATVTLTNATDAAKFALNMRLAAVSGTTLSPTLRAGFATVTGINRQTGTLTVATTWAGQITSISTDYLVRAGDSASGGTATVLSGFDGWISGTAQTWFGLDTTSDVTRFAGQTYDATGVQWTEALIEASARVNQQGAPQPTVAMANPRQVANMKKFLDAKRQYDRSVVESSVAGVSFKAIEIEGDEEPIKIMTSPFVSLTDCKLMYTPSWTLRSLKPAPHMQDYDSNAFLRVSNDDAYEVRFASWPNAGCNMPYANIALTNWGA